MRITPRIITKCLQKGIIPTDPRFPGMVRFLMEQEEEQRQREEQRRAARLRPTMRDYLEG